MEPISKTNSPPPGTWEKLPTERMERKPRVVFDINIPVQLTLLGEPVEYMGDNGAYYIFDVQEKGEDKVIMTSAWSLMRELKLLTPLAGKKVEITKKMEKGKQTFAVRMLD